MNSIEKDFRSEMDQIETERIDSELPAILAGKVEGFIIWHTDKGYPFFREHNYWRRVDTGNVQYTLSDLYDYWLREVDGKK